MTFWRSLSEKAKDALIALGVMIPAILIYAAIRVAGLNLYDLLGWLLI